MEQTEHAREAVDLYIGRSYNFRSGHTTPNATKLNRFDSTTLIMSNL